MKTLFLLKFLSIFLLIWSMVWPSKEILCSRHFAVPDRA